MGLDLLAQKAALPLGLKFLTVPHSDEGSENLQAAGRDGGEFTGSGVLCCCRLFP